MPTRQELIANGRSNEEIAREIGADALIYQDLDALKAAVRESNPRLMEFETSCFDGNYITGDVTREYLDSVEHHRNCANGEASEEEQSTQLDLGLVETD
jgi:amidophosphoribosyltransferase